MLSMSSSIERLFDTPSRCRCKVRFRPPSWIGIAVFNTVLCLTTSQLHGTIFLQVRKKILHEIASQVLVTPILARAWWAAKLSWNIDLEDWFCSDGIHVCFSKDGKHHDKTPFEADLLTKLIVIWWSWWCHNVTYIWVKTSSGMACCLMAPSHYWLICQCIPISKS